jgi:hypothetical protein
MIWMVIGPHAVRLSQGDGNEQFNDRAWSRPNRPRRGCRSSAAVLAVLAVLMLVFTARLISVLVATAFEADPNPERSTMNMRHNIARYGVMTAFIVGVVALAIPARSAIAGDSLTLAPAAAFVQAGYGDQHTDAYLVGVTWYLPWHFDFSAGTLAASVGASIGRWRTVGSRGDTTAWPTQLGVTPVLRLYPSLAPHWFVEIGVGPNYIVPLFHSGEKRFSTEFNFGDHFAIGRRFGTSEVSLRVEHFSNAGIDHPNPGENFVQVRYSFRI